MNFDQEVVKRKFVTLEKTFRMKYYTIQPMVIIPYIKQFNGT